MVAYSFLVCGISNALDGSQNQFIRKDIPIEHKDVSENCESDDEEFEGFDAEDIPEFGYQVSLCSYCLFSYAKSVSTKLSWLGK